ncbi:MAG TPA: hypothetical protein VEA40_25995, partial [Ramlibacter sp.]|nr:hypothetical protein [Ramlibacter sp.]
LPVCTGAPPPRAEVPVPARMKLAPGELARMVAVALQGHGAALGVAEDAGLLAAFAQGLGKPAVAAVLQHCKAMERSALLAAPAALDQALATQGSEVRTCVDAWLVEGLAVQVARRGFVGRLHWRSNSDRGCLVAAPAPGGVRLAAVPPEAGDLREDGFVLQVLPPSANSIPPDARDLAAQEAAWHRNGLDLATCEFWALHDAGKALLVPQADEPRFLPAGMDPLKSF